MSSTDTVSFLEHVQELRRRLMLAVGALILGSVLGYFLLDHLVRWLSKPFGKTLYYTAPTGQLSFLIKVCLMFGLIVGSPVIIYQLARFAEPLFEKRAKIRVVRFVLFSLVLAISGAAFAYFLSLPLTLQFLTDVGKSTETIAPLISADEYFSFIITYISGFALLFQIPLIVSIFNNIRPLDPKSFLKSIRYVVLLSFIIAAIVTPTPDPINQSIMAAPVVVLYLVSGLVVLISRAIRKKSKPAKMAPLPAQPLPAEKQVEQDVLLEALIKAYDQEQSAEPAVTRVETQPLKPEKETVNQVRPVMDIITRDQKVRPKPYSQRPPTRRPINLRPENQLISDFR